MDKATSGEIIVGDQTISNYSDKKLTEYRAKDVGFIFQFYNILPTLTVQENVELIREIVEYPKDAIKVLKKVGLEEHLNKFPNQLSRRRATKSINSKSNSKRPNPSIM